jgi:hypothetical protein
VGELDGHLDGLKAPKGHAHNRGGVADPKKVAAVDYGLDELVARSDDRPWFCR